MGKQEKSNLTKSKTMMCDNYPERFLICAYYSSFVFRVWSASHQVSLTLDFEGEFPVVRLLVCKL